MKNCYLLLATATLLLNLLSCTQLTNSEKNQATETSNAFIIDDKKMAFTQSEYGTNLFRFQYKGTIANNTSNIYKKATVTMFVEFGLENGVVLNDVEIAFSKNTFGAAHGFDSVQMFQPNQVYDLMYMNTEPISVDYLKYPVKSVLLTFQVNTTDEINGTTEEFIVKSEDITNEWKKAVNGQFEKEFK